MKKMMIAVSALIAAGPAYSLPIVTLHGGGGVMATGQVDTTLMVVGLLAVAAIMGIRLYKRRSPD